MNRAAELGLVFYEHIANQRIEEAMRLITDDFVGVLRDHAGLVVTPDVMRQMARNAQELETVEFWISVEEERGDRFALHRYSTRTDDGFTTEKLITSELNAEGLFIRSERFNAEHEDRARALLDEWSAG